MPINRQELTNIGQANLTRAENGETLNITELVVGTGRAGQASDLWPLEQLNQERHRFAITQRVNLGGGQLLLEGSFTSTETTPPAWELCELGVMAGIGAETPTLYCTSNVFAAGADIVNPGTPSIHAFKIKIFIGRAPSVTIVLGTSTDILAENIGAETVGPGWFESKLANTLRFKRAVEGDGIELLEGPETVTIARKALRTNLDLFVDLGAPDVFPNFSTLQNALDYLDDFFIPVDVISRIRIGPGRWPETNTITVDHPNGSQIQIIGTLGTTKTPTGIITNANDPFITLLGPPGTFSDLAVNDFIYWDAGAAHGSGVWPLTAVAADGSSCTYQVVWGNLPASDFVPGTLIYPMRTVLPFNINRVGIDVDNPSGLGLIENIMLSGFPNSAGQISGLACSRGTVNAHRVGAYGWHYGVNSLFGGGFGASGGALILTDCAASWCANGFNGTRSISLINGRNVIATSCTNNGFWTDGSANMQLRLYASKCNRGQGLRAANKGYLVLDEGTSTANSSEGLGCQSGATVITLSQNGGNTIRYQLPAVGDILILALSVVENNGPIPINYQFTNWVAAVGLEISADGCIFKPGATATLLPGPVPERS